MSALLKRIRQNSLSKHASKSFLYNKGRGIKIEGRMLFGVSSRPHTPASNSTFLSERKNRPWGGWMTFIYLFFGNVTDGGGQPTYNDDI